MQYFDVSKPIRVKIDASGKAIGGVLCQQDTDNNWHPVAYYSRKMAPVERNYETHDAKLLAIVEGFRTWRHYFEGAAHTILVLTDHNNLKKFMETTRLSGRQIRWAQELSRYDFKINYRPGSKNPADALSRPLTNEDAEKELVEQNRKIFDKLQHSLSENNESLLNASCQAVTQSTMCDKENYSWHHCMNMFEILIAGIVASSKVKKLWSHISNALYQESPYATVCTVIAYLLELQQEDPMARTVQKELTTPNLNVYSGQSGEPWSEVEGVLHYDGKPYIPETL